MRVSQPNRGNKVWKWSFSKRIQLENQPGGREKVVKDAEIDWFVKNNG